MKKIVLVEGRQGLAGVAEYNLERAGHTVETVRSFDGLHEKLKTDPPDVLILNPYLGGGEYPGLAFIEQMKSDPATADIPIVALVPSSRASSLENMFGTGADYHLMGPVNPLELMRVLGYLLHELPPTMPRRSSVR